MVRREHREFLRRLNAHAQLSPFAYLAGNDELDNIVSDATRVTALVEVGVANSGDKAAGPTTLIVAAPVHEDIRWCDAAGRDLPGDPGISREGITVPAPSGHGRAPVEAHDLETELPRISLKSPAIRHVRVNAAVPTEQGRPHVVPLRILLPDQMISPMTSMRSGSVGSSRFGRPRSIGRCWSGASGGQIRHRVDGRRRIKPPSRIWGTRAHECPKRRISPHIRAYSGLEPSAAPMRNPCKLSHSRRAAFRDRPIAMQKVVGSNPISRFASNLLHFGRLTLPGETNHPCISPRHRFPPISARFPGGRGATTSLRP
jgi:hypothetical protein